MPFDADDFAQFIHPDMPGYRLATIDGTSVGGLFRAPYAESFGLVPAESPSFLALSSELAAVSPGDGVDIAGASYLVASVRPNGDDGLTLLELK